MKMYAGESLRTTADLLSWDRFRSILSRPGITTWFKRIKTAKEPAGIPGAHSPGLQNKTAYLPDRNKTY